jgi:hypothetical protein
MCDWITKEYFLRIRKLKENDEEKDKRWLVSIVIVSMRVTSSERFSNLRF